MQIDRLKEIAADDLAVTTSGDDVCLVLPEWELNELTRVLDEWVENNNIVKVQTVARLNTQIKDFIKAAK